MNLEDHRMLVRKQESTVASKLKVDVTQSTKQVSVAPRKVYDVLELWFLNYFRHDKSFQVMPLLNKKIKVSIFFQKKSI